MARWLLSYQGVLLLFLCFKAHSPFCNAVSWAHIIELISSISCFWVKKQYQRVGYIILNLRLENYFSNDNISWNSNKTILHLFMNFGSCNALLMILNLQYIAGSSRGLLKHRLLGSFFSVFSLFYKPGIKSKMAFLTSSQGTFMLLVQMP